MSEIWINVSLLHSDTGLAAVATVYTVKVILQILFYYSLQLSAKR